MKIGLLHGARAIVIIARILDLGICGDTCAVGMCYGKP